MKKLALFGAGIANLALAKELEKLLQKENQEIEIILVDPKDYVEIPFSMIRSMLENSSLGKISRKKIKDMFSNLRHIQSKLKTLKIYSAILEDGQEIEFDYAVIATGAHSRGFDQLGPTYIDSLEERTKLWDKMGEDIKSAQEIIIAGGGVIGVELAGEILSAYPDKKLRLISGADRLLGHMDIKASKKALKVLQKLGKNFSVTFNDRVEYEPSMDTSKTKEVKTQSGKTYKADIVFITMGNEYRSEFMKDNFAAMLDEKNRIKTNSKLQLQGHDHIFVIGDISNFSKTTLGHIAMDQGIHTAHNLLRIQKANELKPFEIGKMEKLEFITIGKKHGIAVTPMGRADFLIKLKQKDFFAPKILSSGRAR